MTRLLLCDDHTMFRQGLRSILETEEGFRVIGEAATGREAVRYALSTHPDVIVDGYSDARLRRCGGDPDDFRRVSQS